MYSVCIYIHVWVCVREKVCARTYVERDTKRTCVEAVGGGVWCVSVCGCASGRLRLRLRL
eukprot:m.21384 g.21384  ORF g.21384 m.21384 type:complete len:60 (-) comp13366_c1_seq1:22-201(-)